MASADYEGMRSTRCLVVAVICASACAADAPTIITPDADGGEIRPIEPAYASDLTSLTEGDDDICSLLPASGPCALACDEGALAEQYVPAGACAAFLCKLTDGREIAVHVCHVGD